MNISMKSLVILSLVNFSIVSRLNADTVLYETGDVGPTGISWQDVVDQVVLAANVNDASYQGVRFELTEPVMTSSLGGHFVDPPNTNESLFASIVALESSSDFPNSEDLSTPDVLGSTLMQFPEPSDKVLGEIELSLSAGWYALVFGSGLFGATGVGGAMQNNTDVGSPDFIGFQSGSGWGTRVSGMHFSLNGTIVPEPTTTALALFACSSMISCGRHRWLRAYRSSSSPEY